MESLEAALDELLVAKDFRNNYIGVHCATKGCAFCQKNHGGGSIESDFGKVLHDAGFPRGLTSKAAAFDLLLDYSHTFVLDIFVCH